MKWFYVENGQQAGPVEETGFPELLRLGKLRADTLVWHEGMANWEPFSAACPAEFAPSVAAPPMPRTASDAGEAACAECGGIFNKDDMIRHGDLFICAKCKPIFMQKLSEGLVTGARRGRRSLPVNADELIAEITARGFEVNIGSCLSRGWSLVKANLWLCVGATFLVMLCNQAAGFLPIIGILLSLAVQGPLMGGLNKFFIQLIRGESAGIGDAFSGFSKLFWRLCGTFLLMAVFIYVWFIPGVIYFIARLGTRGGPDVLFGILMLLALVAAVYLAVTFTFALPLCADLELGPWDALRVSRCVVNKRWGAIFGLVFVSGLLAALGLLACIVGIFFTMPIFYTATLYAYEDIFGLAPVTNERRA